MDKLKFLGIVQIDHNIVLSQSPNTNKGTGELLTLDPQ